MAIRYDTKLNNEIRKIVNRYNSKVRRLNAKKNDDLIVPELVTRETLKALKESSNNRSELRRQLRTLEDFTKRGGEKNITVKGASIPKYQYQAIKRYRSVISRRLKNREKFNRETVPTVEGVKQDFTIAEQFNEEQQNIKALREKLLNVDFLSKSPSELKAYLDRLVSNARSVNLSTWQQNYADMLLDTAYVYNIPHAKIHELREKILSLSPKEFDKLFKTEATVKQIMYYYKQVNDLGVDVAFENMQDDVLSIYDSLFENIDDILKDYK